MHVFVPAKSIRLHRTSHAIRIGKVQHNDGFLLNDVMMSPDSAMNNILSTARNGFDCIRVEYERNFFDSLMMELNVHAFTLIFARDLPKPTLMMHLTRNRWKKPSGLGRL